MKMRSFKQVDVFTATPYQGNPLAVVLDGTGLSDAAMQHFAHWTNLSETTFVLPPSAQGAAAGADYRVRIFTPGCELPFAGHPTLGSCHAWLQAGGTPRVKHEIVQECAVGLVKIRRRHPAALPPAAQAQQPSPPCPGGGGAGLKARRSSPRSCLTTVDLARLLLDSPQTVLQLLPDHVALTNLGQKVGVASVDAAQAAPALIVRSNREARAFGPRSVEPAAAELEVRAFAAAEGIPEDPVTGSFNASLAQWLIKEGHAPSSYVASQGTCLGRAGRVHIEQDASGQVWVGGDSVTCIDGHVTL
jgi:PhzF family phenazine biosynthesis protein